MPAEQPSNGWVEWLADADDADKVNVLAASEANSSTVIAYYFHRTIRCAGCLEIEAVARQVIETRLAEPLSHATLMWIPFNLDEPGGKEFEKEFDVHGSTLVLTREQNGHRTKYKKLGKTWDFLQQPAALEEYIRKEVEAFLNE